MIDARGLSCPMPVVRVQKEVQKNAPETLEVLVDSMVCVENITRYARRQGYSIDVKEESDQFALTLSK